MEGHKQKFFVVVRFIAQFKCLTRHLNDRKKRGSINRGGKDATRYLSIGLLSILFAQGPYTLSFDLSQFEFSVESGFNRVRGIEMSATTDTGAPELPLKLLNFIVPNGNRVQNIEILSLTVVPVTGTYNIYPVQLEIPLSIYAPPPPSVPPDTSIYNRDALYPDSIPVFILHQGHYDGHPVVTIGVYPLLYNPVKDTLYLIQSITFRFQFESVPMSIRPQIRGRRIHQLYLSGLKSSVFNSWEVDVLYTPPNQIVSDEQLLRLGYPEVIIIAAPACTAAYRPLADWLTQKGMLCFIRSTDWVYQNYDGDWDSIPGSPYPGEHIRDDAAKIKEYLRTLYLTNGTAFAILGGILQPSNLMNSFPFRYCWAANNVDYIHYYDCLWIPWFMPSDLYFQDFTGNWSVDGDYRIGEPGDDRPNYMEEIWVGRVPAWNSEQTVSWVEKRLTYERTPANKELMTQSLWLTQGYQYPINFPALMEQAIQHFPLQFTQHRVVDHPCNEGDHRLMTDTLTVGYGMLSTYGHGAPDAQRVGVVPDWGQLFFSWEKEGRPYLGEPRNINKFYITYSIGCDNAWFDTSTFLDNACYPWTANGPYPCIAEAFVSFYRWPGPSPNGYPPFDAVAFLGNTRSGWSGSSPQLHRNFIDRLFFYDTLIGLAEARARYYPNWPYWYVTYSHNLFGSPEMPVWTEIPLDLIVEHIDAIPSNTPIDFQVHVHNINGPLANALVTLYKEPEGYPAESQRTDPGGMAIFNDLTVPTTGIMKVTVTASNHIPYQGDVQVFEYTVDFPTAHTQYTEGRKLVRQFDTENLHLGYTYGIGGADIPNEWANYSFSTDGGSTWSSGVSVLPDGYNHNPSIDLTNDNRPCIAFRKSTGWLTEQSAVIYFARYDEPDWVIYTIDSYPATPTFTPSVSPPSIIIDANDICHLVYSGVLYAPGKAYVIYKRFDVFNPSTETVIIDSANVPINWQPSSPCIATYYGYPHIVWDFPPEGGEPYPEIWYRCLEESGWSEKINISNSNDKPSEHPFITTTNEKVLVVWSEEEEAGNTESRDIYKGERFITAPPNAWNIWAEIVTPNQASDWPVITANGEFLVWAEHQFIELRQNWEILYKSSIYGSGNLSNTPYTQSLYASCDWRQTLNNLYLYSAFTEKYEYELEPYIFGVKTKTLVFSLITPIPTYTIYAGSKIPSPYLIQRDGYIAYGNYPVDYDTNELVYKFSGLKPALKYRLDVTAYHEYGGEWREWVKIDNTAQHLIKYDAGVPRTVELPVPPASYRDDGEIVVRISKITGDFAMCHKGNLYGFEKEGQGGPQTAVDIPQNLTFACKVTPNIIMHQAQLQFILPEKQRVRLNLYDVVGRKAVTITDNTFEPGIYTYSLNTERLSSGIYFLVLTGEKETKTQKVLIVR
ncbi:MAG: C25 family cysteine peptidase [candidate division WOR-3 bacterium]